MREHARGGPHGLGLAGRSHLPALDGVRAAAVTAVLAYHAQLRGLRGGFLGVDVFFVLSGFLITSLLLDESARTGTVDVRAFYARRARRLLPALAVVLAATAVVIPFAWGLQPVAWRTLAGLPLAALYLGNAFPLFGLRSIGFAGHLWSLAVEEHFYVVWPLVARRVGRDARQATRRIGLLFALAVGYRATATALGASHLRMYLGSDMRASQLLAGCLLASLHRDGTLARVATTRLWTAALVVSGALLAAGMALVPDTARLLDTGGSTAVALAAAVLIGHLVVHGTGRLARLASRRPLTWMGERSYGIYLWHLPVGGVVAGLLPAASRAERLAEVVVIWMLTAGLAAASHHYIEMPWRRRTVRSVGDRDHDRDGVRVTAALAPTGR